MPPANPSPHHLLLCLGTGPIPNPAEPLARREYRKEIYFCPDRPEAQVETPFVGEAILRLHAGRFTHVHIFGTTDSMWDTLYSYLLNTADAQGEGYSEAEYEHDTLLREAVNSRSLEADASALGRLEERFSRRHGVVCTCRVVPLPRTEADFRQTLQTVAASGIEKGAVSIDVTHGLRIQPFFLLLTLLYLRTVREGLEPGTAFYGARDMMKHYGGRAPLFEQRALLSMFDWIDAARAFDRYGDAGPVAALLPEGDGQAQLFSNFSSILQLNALRDLRADARRLHSAYAKLPEGAPAPLEYLLPRLMRLPKALAEAKRPWEAKMLLAGRHAAAQNLGLAVVVAWEAALDRVAEAYGLTPEMRRVKENSSDLTNITSGGPHEVRRLLDRLPSFKTRTRIGPWKNAPRSEGPLDAPLGQALRTLQLVRNALAHVNEALNDKDVFEPQQVHQLAAEGLFDYLAKRLADPAFDELPRVYPKRWLPAAAPAKKRSGGGAGARRPH